MSKYGLVSVFNKRNIVGFSQFLCNKGINILSSTGTARLLKENSLDITEISDYTGSPEILGGRVKTLHPKIYGGILQDTHNPEHVRDMREAEVPPISVVVTNLYPFEEKNCIENIDIGGVTLIRAAAKNHDSVLVVVDPDDYESIINQYDAIMANDASGKSLRRMFARKAFHYVTNYDIAIANYFEDETLHIKNGGMPETFYRTYIKRQDLKYGCNPHQEKAAAYAIKQPLKSAELPFTVENGKPGYINVLDALYSWQLVNEVHDVLDVACAASFKHNAPAGVGTALQLPSSLLETYDLKGSDISTPASIAFIRARNCDPLSSFGDFIAISDVVDEGTAKLIKREISDGIIAPGYTEEALNILKTKKNGGFIILVGKKEADYKNNQTIEFKEVNGCAVMQSVNKNVTGPTYFDECVTENKEVDLTHKNDMILANITLKYTPSNSVAAAYDGQVIGIGAGQQNRVDCVKIVQNKVNNWYLRQHPSTVLHNKKIKEFGMRRQERINSVMNYITSDAEFMKERDSFISDLSTKYDMVLASDAFFPFSDSIDVAAQMGVTHIIQPGGSIMDEVVTKAANKYGMYMATSKVRVFTH